MATFANVTANRDMLPAQPILIPDEADSDNPFGDRPLGFFNFHSLLTLLRAHVWLILGIIFGVLALGVVMTLTTTPRYTALATIQINEQSDRVLKEGDDISAPSDIYDTDRFLQTQIDILRSRGLALRVAQSLKLIGNPEFYRAMGAEPPRQGTPPDIVRDRTLGLLQANLEAKLPRTSRIVTVSFVSNDPQLSARIANSFVKEFIAASLQRKYDSSAYARSFISDQLNESKNRLEASEKALNGYARAAGLFRTGQALGAQSNDNAGSGSVTSASLEQINQAANEARAARVAAETRWRAMSGSAGVNAPDVLGNVTVQSLLAQRADVQARLRLESARHLPDHPSVIQLKAQAQEVNSQLNAVVGSVRASVKAQYDAAAAAERQLEAQVAALKGDSMAEQDRSVQYNILAREANTNRILYDGLLQRFKELNAASGISTSNIAIIDLADPPLSPSSPNLMLNLGIALLLGTALAAVVVLIRDQFDDSIRVPDDVEHKLHLPLLGVIPKSGEDVGNEISDPKSAVAEAYSSLGGSLLYSTPQGLPRVLLVTSAQPTEGKSTTSFAIAGNFARIGRRVLLIDADLRRPSLHRRIGTDNKLGMTTLLTSSDPVETVIIPMPQTGLSVITSGPIPPSPSELIASHRMQVLIDELAEKFDLVIIDSPPVLGLADAPLMAPLADGVIMVVEADRGRRGTLKAALRRLRAMRPQILGAVLTKFDSRRSNYRYSYYYSADYYAYKSEDAKAQARAG